MVRPKSSIAAPMPARRRDSEKRESAATTSRARTSSPPSSVTRASFGSSASPVFGSAEDDATGASFASFVYPGKRWAFAVYRHELANFKSAFASDGIRLSTGPSIDPYVAAVDLDIQNFGVAAAAQVTSRLSIGVGLSLYDLDGGVAGEGDL